MFIKLPNLMFGYTGWMKKAHIYYDLIYFIDILNFMFAYFRLAIFHMLFHLAMLMSFFLWFLFFFRVLCYVIQFVFICLFIWLKNLDGLPPLLPLMTT